MNKNLKTTSCECIILWKHKRGEYTFVPFINKQGEIMQGIIKNNVALKLKGMGYLQPLAHVHLSYLENMFIKQVDGIHALNVLTEMDNIAYISFLGELLKKLFPEGSVHKDLFILLRKFTIHVKDKSIPLGSIILAWQLLGVAGLHGQGQKFWHNRQEFQNEIYAATATKINETNLQNLDKILNYTWTPQDKLSLKEQDWNYLAKLLFVYCRHRIDEKFESIEFIETMGCELL